MKKYYFILTLFLAFLYVSNAEESSSVVMPNGKTLTASKILNAGSSGNEFVIAIPSNDINNVSGEFIGFYLTSPFNTIVKIKDNMSDGSGMNKLVNAYKITTIVRSMTDEISSISEFETPINRTFTLTSSKRFSVYVMNRKATSSDGYLAIPTSGWGKKYMHLCNYDNPEYVGSQGYNNGSGFVVLAKSNNTHVTIHLVDQANKKMYPYYGLGRTTVGKKGDDIINVTLSMGQAYAIQGNGAGSGSGSAIGYLDLSGSEIESDSLIGLISYHNRTDIPVNLNDSRNYLVEMLPPISAWGTEVATQEFERSDYGDLIRIVASEDNTNLTLRWYDKGTKAILNDTRRLLNKGDVWEYLNNTNQSGYLTGVRGMCIFTADHPILVNQYAYSSGWDNNKDYDPFMITLTPTNQYIPATVFQTPADFTTNYFDYIVKGYLPEDTLNPIFINPNTKKRYSPSVINDMKLNSLYFGSDKGELAQITTISSHHIPTSGGYKTTTGDTIGGLYWGRIPVGEGVYIMESKDYTTTFGGHIYGSSEVDVYGWPAALAYKKSGDLDIEKPKRTMKNQIDSADWAFRYADTMNYDINDSTRQIDMGLSLIYLVSDTNASDKKPWSFNFTLIDSVGDAVDAISADDASYSFKLKVIDPTQAGRALIRIVDKNYNFANDTVYYKMTPTKVDEIPSSSILNVSPNPAGELLNITVNSNQIGDYELSLYNLIGDKIRILSNGTLAGNAKSLEIATDGISAGSYYIRLKIGENTETKKIIINK